MTEEVLFAAYRNAEGWASECACGATIHSQYGTESAVAEAIRMHQESTVHRQWRSWQEAVEALQRPVTRPCPCHGAA